ncbi:hypothetical protein KL930_001851 [Ogataea haglerorum]|uniref:Charged multivesicular body protein 6 n=1 Tax=Ogataea haglerorum TaxID=1937702 RepID=A0AAN6I201_9ASCO|nr:uncharacterized protein KL911_001792 [Ogataea haglerorum]KAG7698189.1 hypothetical protein KL915_001906 [Ogataea haglerorum]KAG7699517.1 hypothetical protein KL951_001234 [Ogataea haglerorum]KAG7708410.1 hypothetical protein KL914_002136 [Ogataea haglerorum]KAG7710562.1 hypothetical protein KL950_001475 [Ogataea haglerorum]KAG7721183.1 hypothetical protein KL913_000919 [Ogataea haglerorum]
MGNTTSSGPKITPQDKAILQLKLQRDRLHKVSVKIQTVVDRETEIAKQCVKQNNRRKALLALKKKKYQQNLLSTVEKQAETLEELINTIEFKLIEKDFVYGLEQGNQVLKNLNKELSIEKVDKILDDSEEGIRYQEELSERLGELMSKSLEDEVDLELAELEKQERAKEAPKKDVASQLPDVVNKPLPDIKPKQPEEREEEQPATLPA